MLSTLDKTQIVELQAGAEEASAFLKALANPMRLQLLCLLAEGERNVNELTDVLEARQPAVSQQLSRLREAGLVEAERRGKEMYYALVPGETEQIIKLLYTRFCAGRSQARDADTITWPEG